MAARPQNAEGAEASQPLAALEQHLGYTFRDRELLQLALTHRSFAYEKRGIDVRAKDRPRIGSGEDNERLEFVGDAVLGLLVAEALYRQFPACSEGDLTRLRAALVSGQRMAEAGTAMRLHEFLVLGKSMDGATAADRPALIANAAEAVLAAMYLDGGLEPARAVVERVLLAPSRAELEAAVNRAPGSALRDWKTLLQERVQAAVAGRLRYVDADVTGPAHRRRFAVDAVLESEAETRTLARGDGATKKEAQQKAAEAALAAWPEAPTA
jgi:ribonuclease-3